MTERSRLLLATLALISVASSAYADPDESVFYGTVFVDGDLPYLPESKNFSGSAPTSIDSTLEGGFVVGGALGRSWSGLGPVVPRTELELSYRQGDTDGIGLPGTASIGNFNTTGDSSSTSIVGKIMLDVPVGESVLTPYLGAGVGIQQNDRGFTSGNGLPLVGSDEDYSAQVLAGVSHSLAEQLDLSLDGRYQRSIDGGSDAAAAGSGDDDGLGIFSFFLRLRAKF